MSRKFVSRGFAPVVTLVAVLLLTLGVGVAVFVASKGTGFVNFASQSRVGTWTGTIGKTTNCIISPNSCFSLKETSSGKVFQVVSPTVNLGKYVGKKVTVQGAQDLGDAIPSRRSTIIIVTKVVSDVGGGGGGGTKVENADLGLTLVPGLNINLSQIDILAKWKRVTRKKATFKQYHLYLLDSNDKVIVSADSSETLPEPEKLFTAVLVASGKEYTMRLDAEFEQKDESKLLLRQESKIGYFEDGFFDVNNWDITTAGQASAKAEAGVLVLRSASGNGSWTTIRLKPKAGKLTFPTRGKSFDFWLNALSFSSTGPGSVTLYMNFVCASNDELSFNYGSGDNNLFNILETRSGTTDWTEIYSHASSDPEIYRVSYRGDSINLSPIVLYGPNNSYSRHLQYCAGPASLSDVYFFADSTNAQGDLLAKFDNFRFVWVK